MGQENRAKLRRDDVRGTTVRLPKEVAERLPDGELEIEFAVNDDEGVITMTPVEVATKPAKLKKPVASE